MVEDRTGSGADERPVIMYNKLVRDRVIGRIQAEGDDSLQYRVITDRVELRRLLIDKLREELAEYEKEPGFSELADIQETVYRLAKLDGDDDHYSRLRAARTEKSATNGTFSQGHFLIQARAPKPRPSTPA